MSWVKSPFVAAIAGAGIAATAVGDVAIAQTELTGDVSIGDTEARPDDSAIFQLRSLRSIQPLTSGVTAMQTRLQTGGAARAGTRSCRIPACGGAATTNVQEAGQKCD